MPGAQAVSIAAGVPILSAAVNLAKNGTREVIAAPGTGLRIQVHGLHVGTDANGTAQFLSDAAALTGVIPMLVAGNQGINWEMSPDPSAYHIRCAEDKALNVVLSANSDLDGVINYRIRKTSEG